jgi:hypothetical protein
LEGARTRRRRGRRKEPEGRGECKVDEIWFLLSQHRHSPSDRARSGQVMAFSPLRTRLLTTLRGPCRTFTSLSDVSEKRLLSQDDWTAFQVQRAERSALS